DKFPGAFYSVALDIPVGEARTLQIGTIHHYRENFSRPYAIRYEAADGQQQFVHQTTFGLSERLIGAVVAVHGDQKGIIFPPSLAPHQVVIIPIASKTGPAPIEAARQLAARLSARGIRTHVDDGDERPGAKYYHWELLGVPLRLDLGPREAQSGTVTAVDRLGQRETLGPSSVEEGVAAALARFDAQLLERATALFSASFLLAGSLDELVDSKKVRVIEWCGSEECGHRIESSIDGALLGTPEAPLPIPVGAPTRCIACGSTTGTRWAVAARPL
ncbi:MAG: His/Gly/Thr/Pro-type tRNA ligase C-terminal domain-containing protein, partial [Thermoplasmata archaeon]|nr:His/Gly/Thr/Pro-type tRNA ligase C-terminal domain-containing protein [Thermoplasmata archaeon]